MLIPASNRCQHWETQSSFHGVRFGDEFHLRKIGSHRNSDASWIFSYLCLSVFSFPFSCSLFHVWSFRRFFCGVPFHGDDGGDEKSGRSRNRSRCRERMKKGRLNHANDGASCVCHPFWDAEAEKRREEEFRESKQCS